MSRAVYVAAAFAGLVSPVYALSIVLDYSYDVGDEAGGGSFFADHPIARQSLEAAAADLSSAITSTLAAVPTDTFTGTSGPAVATFDWSLNFQNPVTGAPVTIDTWTPTFLPADVVRIYVGMRPLAGGTLGTGGPGGAGVGASWIGSGSSLNAAVQNAEAASNAVMTRGTTLTNGPIIGSLSGTLDTAPYNLHFGALLGNLWFDNDTDNSGGIDSDTTLDAFWHFELGLPVESTQFDFYSVALHELLHSIGFGTSETWNSNHSGTNWLGSNADALDPQGGVGLVTLDGHIREGFMSPRLTDGALQEAVMDPSLTNGQRKYLTQMDLAFLRDLQYTTVPEPGSVLLLVVGAALASATSRKRSRLPAPSGGRSCRHSSRRDTRVPARRACSS